MSKPNPEKKKKPLHEYPEKTLGGELLTHIGLDSLRRHAIHCIADNIVLTAAGNLVLFVNYATGVIESFSGPLQGGIGAVGVHPSRKHFVVCEKAPQNPRVVVYEYPSKKQAFVFNGGAMQGYSALAFNNDGSLLATVATEPDFMLTIWNWKEQKTVLRNKAFGSDVYSIAFNPFSDGRLVSSGMGHIKFWSMAETFTGLKLQGNVGKFGRLEISDVTGFASFADGKVISGSESGSLLLWEGNLVKCELVREAKEGETPEIDGTTWCRSHQNGSVETVMMIEKGRIIMSAGSDGYIRYWNAQQIDGAEGTNMDMQCPIKCLKELYVGEGVNIKDMTLSVGGDHWVILDGSGSLRKVPCWGYDAIMADVTPTVKPAPALLSFNCGGILSAAASPTDHSVITGGQDGTLRLVDYLNKKELYRTPFDSAVVQLQHFPLTVDADGTLFLAGFQNGSIRLLRKSTHSFNLIGAWRPHSGKLLGFSMDKFCTKIYTCSDDGTAFYFTVENNGTKITPIGYCRLPAVATSLEWSPTGDACYFALPKGDVISVKPPVVNDINHEVGYEFDVEYSGVGYRQKLKPPEKVKRILPNGDVEESSSDEEDEDEVDHGPWPVQFIRRMPDDTMLVGLDKEELAYTYKLTTLYPNQLGAPPIPATGIDPPGRVEEPIKNLCYRDYLSQDAYVSSSGNFVAVICEKSRVLIRPTNNILSVTHAAQLHDAIDGRITAATISFDDTVLITTGLDGLVVAQLILSKGTEAPKVAANPQTYRAHTEERPIAPGPIAFSIQKQKEEDDRHRAEEAALGKKQQLLRKIHLVHKEYMSIIEGNIAAAGGMKLSEKELELDEELTSALDGELTGRVEQARLDYSWVSAKKESQLQKLKSTYIDRLQFDRFVLHSFEGGVEVASFRTAHFTEEQKAAMEQLNELLEAAAAAEEAAAADENAEGENDEQETGSNPHSSPASRAGGGPLPGGDETLDRIGNEHGGHNSTINNHSTTMGKTAAKSQLEKAEERKTERLERKRGYEMLVARKPKGTDDDARNAKEVGEAEATLGDFILKTSPKYIVPDHMKATSERKTKQLVLLEHSINRLRMEFNQRLLALRDLKGRLCTDINTDRDRIRDIATKLKLEGVDPQKVGLIPTEEPEKRFVIDREGLDHFAEEIEKERKKQEALQRAKKGFGADLASMDDDKEGEGDKKDEDGAQKRVSARESLVRKPSHAPAGPISTREKLEMDVRYKLENLRLSELEEEELAMEREQLTFEKSRLERRVASTIASFDEKLQDFYQERMRLEADLCMADMRVLLLFREYKLLLEFRKKDNELTAKLEERKNELRDIAKKSRQCIERVNEKNQASESLRKRMGETAQDAEAFIRENFPADAHVYLMKVFRRKVKRRRANENEEDDDDDVTSEDDEEEVQEEEDDGIDEEECPANCDQDAWLELLQLRERKLDCDDDSADLLKAIYGLKKESDDLRKREEQTQTALRNCEKDIASFQTEKQAQLNLLETIVVLKLSQIQCLTDDRRLPKQLNHPDIVVFTQSGMRSLRDRILSLADEKSAFRGALSVLGHEKSKLNRRNVKRQAEFNEWESKVNEVQLLKFGQRINLEHLENVSVDRETEELKEKLRLEEHKWEKELLRINDVHASYRQESQQRIVENTALLKDLGSLRAQQHDLEHALVESTSRVVSKMSGGSKVATATDRANLKDLVVAQQHELDALKAEIAMLRRKGGHVYTPVVQHPATR